MENTENKDKDKKYVTEYVKWDNYDKLKLTYFKKWTKEEDTITFLYPKYKYHRHLFKTLKIMTPFIVLDKDLKSNYLEIELDNVYMNQLSNFLKTYQEFLDNFIKKEYSDKIVSIFPLIKNNRVKLYLKINKNGNIKTKIINYNISKKFPKYEIFSEIEKNKINRFLKKDKEVRFIIEPFSWVNDKNNYYGSRLYISSMEVKFKGANIESMIENKNNETNIIREIEI